MLNRFNMIFVICFFSACSQANDLDSCNSNLLVTYQKIVNHESQRNSIVEIPPALKHELDTLLLKCKSNSEPFIFIKDFLNDNASAFVSYLDLSIISGNIKLFEYFLGRKEAMSPKTGTYSHFIAGWSYLHVAAHYGGTLHIDKLLYEGEDINAKDLYGMTPLMLSLDNPENFIYLIEKGADPNIQNKSGLSAVCWASKLAENKILSFMNAKGLKCLSSKH